jgi:hypothetical protein
LEDNGENKMRAVSVSHVEYEILRTLLENVDVSDVKDDVAVDEVSEKRFVQAGKNVMQLVENLAERRRHKLPESHVDYQEKVSK